MRSSTSACSASASIRRAPSRTMSSITDEDSPSATLPIRASCPAGSGTTVSMGRTFPTSVGAPVLLENLHSITGKVRPSRSSTGLKHCSARVDLAFIDQRVAVEYDGSWREGELWALNRDRERLNQVQAQGWEGVFVTAA